VSVEKGILHYEKNSFEKNLIALKNTAMKRTTLFKEPAQMFDEEQETINLNEMFLEKCYNERFKSLCNSMDKERFYEDSHGHYMRIKLDKDWIKPNIGILKGTVKVTTKPVYRSHNVDIFTDDNKVWIRIRYLIQWQNIYLINPINNNKTKVDETFKNLPLYVCDGNILVYVAKYTK